MNIHLCVFLLLALSLFLYYAKFQREMKEKFEMTAQIYRNENSCGSRANVSHTLYTSHEFKYILIRALKWLLWGELKEQQKKLAEGKKN